MAEKENNKNYLTYILVGLLVAAAFALGSLYTKVKVLEKGSVTSNSKETGQTVSPTTLPKAELQVTDEDPSLGPKNAKVTVVEFADFQCPFCGAYAGLDKTMVKNMQARNPSWQPALPSLIKDYVDTNKIRFVWKDYPFLGQESIWAGAGARCAADQGKFWEYHDFLFSHQSGENQGAFSKDNLKKFAVTLGLKTADFNNCIDSGKYESKMQAAQTYGQSVGVSGTPATFINGQMLSGAVPYSQIKPLIDEALKK
ncbi:DsbA family protein [Candidatus Gottesmanbacteria bacterium]|nr:DsbA family protein [Candidatus Gottesmanbacteria bacterium]